MLFADLYLQGSDFMIQISQGRATYAPLAKDFVILAAALTMVSGSFLSMAISTQIDTMPSQ